MSMAVQFPFKTVCLTTNGWGWRARIGVLVPHADIGAEAEFQAMARMAGGLAECTRSEQTSDKEGMEP
jgi:hypothetical protein